MQFMRHATTSTLSKMSKAQGRQVWRTILARPQKEGDVPVRRSIGAAPVTEFMPFLLLDDVRMEGTAGAFGAHPHRGQETITYLTEGSLEHRDSKGNRGHLSAGDLQFMRAGRGVVHDERPVLDPKTNANHGIQLWVALPEQNLQDEATYTDLREADIPVARPIKGVIVKVIAGESFDKSAPVWNRAAVHYLDVQLEAGAEINHSIPDGFSSFVHVLEGYPTVAGQKAQPHETVLLERHGATVSLKNKDVGAARLLLVSGDPLDGQEVHRYGVSLLLPVSVRVHTDIAHSRSFPQVVMVYSRLFMTISMVSTDLRR